VGSESMDKLILGVGTGGCNIINDIEKVAKLYDYLFIDKLLNDPANRFSFSEIIYEKDKKHYPGKMNIKTKRLRESLEEDLEKALLNYTKGYKKISIVVALGGETGSTTVKSVSKILRNKGKKIDIFATSPFLFEEKQKAQRANSTLKALKKTTKKIYLFDNNDLLEIGKDFREILLYYSYRILHKLASKKEWEILKHSLIIEHDSSPEHPKS